MLYPIPPETANLLLVCHNFSARRIGHTLDLPTRIYYFTLHPSNITLSFVQTTEQHYLRFTKDEGVDVVDLLI
jgi:hypothetical protein